jgi:protein-S-isoprenylcysteine O-methyltransferase Ste14
MNNPMKTRPDRTGIVIPPPLLFAVPLLAGWLVNRRWPWSLTAGGTAAVVAGVLLISLGAMIALAGVRRFRRAGTTVLPFGGTSELVISGVYRFTRNPMYLGMTLAYAGATLLLNSVWCALFLPAVLMSIYVLVVRPEERYLSQKFGDQYTRYTAKVRRWI